MVGLNWLGKGLLFVGSKLVDEIPQEVAPDAAKLFEQLKPIVEQAAITAAQAYIQKQMGAPK